MGGGTRPIEVIRASSFDIASVGYQVIEARFPLRDKIPSASGRLTTTSSGIRQLLHGNPSAASAMVLSTSVAPRQPPVAEISQATSYCQSERTEGLAQVGLIVRSFDCDARLRRVLLRLVQCCHRFHVLRKPVIHPPLFFLTNAIYQECLGGGQ